MAINNAIRQLSFALLVALTAAALSAQDASDAINGGSPEAVRSAAATPVTTLAENPPKPPKVTCDGGQLKISADNSTLGSILTAVHACIGVQIDIPAGAGRARTFEELGPGPQREVLESLLSGTNFNYVIGASDADPQKIETVLLMERTTEVALNSPSADRTLSPARRAWLESRQNLRRAGTIIEESPQIAEEPAEPPAVADDATVAPPADNANANATPPSTSDAAPAAADAPAAPVPQDSALIAVPPVTSEVQPADTATNPALDSGKSTAERIGDMQQMFQQRRQMTQSQNPSATQPQ